MAGPIRVALELGPKGKKVVAVAQDWPGLARGATAEEDAVDRLRSYVPRYAPVAALAGLGGEFAGAAGVDVVERYPGTGSTDFWGISFAFSAHDRRPMPAEELERELALLRACWAFFDAARGRAPAGLRKGPRGGGRDRDGIVWHVVANERDWAKKLGLSPGGGAMPTEDGVKAHRDAYAAAIRAHHAQGKAARAWPLRYLVRHTAFHALDHAWEMEDRDPAADPG